MKKAEFYFAKQFSRFPGGRLSAHGPKSGEEFREKVLLPLLNEHEKLTIDLSDVAGFGSSFLDEAFVETSRRVGVDEFERKVEFVCNDDPMLVSMIWRKIRAE